VLLEPASNLEIEETLGNLNVEVERSMFLTGWTRDNTWKKTVEGITVKNAAILGSIISNIIRSGCRPETFKIK